MQSPDYLCFKWYIVKMFVVDNCVYSLEYLKWVFIEGSKFLSNSV